METSQACCSNDRRFPSFFFDNPLRRVVNPPDRVAKRFVKSGQVIADLGSGPGYYTIAFAKSVGESGVVYAVDFDPKAIDKLTSKVKRLGLESVVRAHVSSASRIDFVPDGAVDFVFAHGLLCCMSDHSGAIIVNRSTSVIDELL
jgi:ubiquinone/menaquinone biosynthesis C-methylase UbiE